MLLASLSSLALEGIVLLWLPSDETDIKLEIHPHIYVNKSPDSLPRVASVVLILQL